MTLHGELIPRPDAKPHDLKALGAAIQSWFVEFLRQRAGAGEDVDGWLDQDAVAALLQGELPQPLAARCLPLLHGITIRELIGRLNGARARHPLLRRVLRSAQTRCVGFGFSLGPDARDDLLASLRSHLPLGVVAEFRINGQRYQARG